MNFLLFQRINNEFQSFDPLIIKSDLNQSQSRRSISSSQSTTPIVLFPSISQQTNRKYRLENETAQGILERRRPGTVTQVLNSFLTSKPLVDRIRDEEKYGNTGDKFNGIGRAFINGYDNFSNFLNILTDVSEL